MQSCVALNFKILLILKIITILNERNQIIFSKLSLIGIIVIFQNSNWLYNKGEKRKCPTKLSGTTFEAENRYLCYKKVHSKLPCLLNIPLV